MHSTWFTLLSAKDGLWEDCAVLFCAICTGDLKTRRSKKRPVADGVCLFDSDPHQLWHSQMCREKSDKSAFVTVCVGMKAQIQTQTSNSSKQQANRCQKQTLNTKNRQNYFIIIIYFFFLTTTTDGVCLYSSLTGSLGFTPQCLISSSHTCVCSL